MSEQRNSRTSHQTSHVKSEQTDSQMPVQPKGHTDRRLSSHAERGSKQTDRASTVSSEQRASEEILHSMSGQDNRRASEPIDRGKSGQYDRRTSEPIDHMGSGQDSRRASVPIPHKESDQDDQMAYELMDSRKSGLVERKAYKQVEHRLSDPLGYKTSVKTRHKAHDQIIELAEDQATEDEAGSSIHPHPRVIMPLYSEYEKIDDEDDTDDNQSDFGESDERDDIMHIIEKSKEVDYTLDTKQKDLKESKVSDKIKAEHDAFMNAFNTFDNKVINSLQGKDHNFSPRFPAVSTKLDYVISQQKAQIIVTNPVG